MTTDVMNLRTGIEAFYSLPPTEAVVAAREQDAGNWSTWTYGDTKFVVRRGKRTVSCGDWAAVVKAVS